MQWRKKKIFLNVSCIQILSITQREEHSRDRDCFIGLLLTCFSNRHLKKYLGDNTYQAFRLQKYI